MKKETGFIAGIVDLKEGTPPTRFN